MDSFLIQLLIILDHSVLFCLFAFEQRPVDVFLSPTLWRKKKKKPFLLDFTGHSGWVCRVNVVQMRIAAKKKFAIIYQCSHWWHRDFLLKIGERLYGTARVSTYKQNFFIVLDFKKKREKNGTVFQFEFIFTMPLEENVRRQCGRMWNVTDEVVGPDRSFYRWRRLVLR